MIKLDLITGFLGSGKTTFMRCYVRYLVNKGEKICIIENDFGAINVDMVLLKDLEEMGCNLEMVIGGDGADAHKRRLKTKLISMAMMGYTRVIVEPSGIYDVDEFFDLLYEDPIDGWYEAGNVIAIVNPKLEENLSNLSRYLFMAEIAQAGAIIISRIQECGCDEILHIRERIEEAMKEFDCNQGLGDKLFVEKEWDFLDAHDYEQIIKCGFNRCDHIKIPVSGDNDYQTFFYFDFEMNIDELVNITKKIFNDPDCDGVHRIKGLVQTDTGLFYELNTTRNEIMTQQVNAFRAVLIVIGENIPREKLVDYLGEPTM